MLAPVAEAHFGEAGTGRPQPGRRRPRGPDSPATSRRPPASRSTTAPTGRWWWPATRPTGRPPTGSSPSTRPWGCRRSASASGPAATPSRCWPPGSAAGSTCPTTTRSTTGPSPPRWWRPAGRPASTIVADRVTRIDVDGGRVSGVTLEDGAPIGRPRGGAGRRAAGRARSAGVPDGLAALRSGRSGASPSGCGRPTASPACAGTVRALVHGRSCYLVPRDDGGLVLGATVEERGFALDVPLGGLADLVEDARRVVPAVDEYVGGRGGPGPATRHARQRSHRRAPRRSTGWWWPPATTATASCWPRLTADEVVALLEPGPPSPAPADPGPSTPSGRPASPTGGTAP